MKLATVLFQHSHRPSRAIHIGWVSGWGESTPAGSLCRPRRLTSCIFTRDLSRATCKICKRRMAIIELKQDIALLPRMEENEMNQRLSHRVATREEFTRVEIEKLGFKIWGNCYSADRPFAHFTDTFSRRLSGRNAFPCYTPHKGETHWLFVWEGRG